MGTLPRRTAPFFSSCTPCTLHLLASCRPYRKADSRVCVCVCVCVCSGAGLPLPGLVAPSSHGKRSRFGEQFLGGNVGFHSAPGSEYGDDMEPMLHLTLGDIPLEGSAGNHTNDVTRRLPQPTQLGRVSTSLRMRACLSLQAVCCTPWPSEEAAAVSACMDRARPDVWCLSMCVLCV